MEREGKGRAMNGRHFQESKNEENLQIDQTDIQPTRKQNEESTLTEQAEPDEQNALHLRMKQRPKESQQASKERAERRTCK